MNRLKQITLTMLVVAISVWSYAQSNPEVLVESTKTSKEAKTYNQGVKFFKNGDNNAALAKFDESISQKRSFLDPFLGKGYVLLLDKQYKESLVYLELYKTKGGTSKAVDECIADAYRGLGDMGSALEVMSDAVANNPNDVRILRKRASMYVEAGRYAEAVKDLDAAINQDKENKMLYQERAAAKKLNKDYEGAVADYSTLIEKDNSNAYYYSSRGVTYGEMSEYEDAIADFDKAIELKSDYYAAYNNRAVANIGKEDYEAAEKDLKYVIEKDSKNALAYNNLGIVCFKQEQIEESIKYYDKAIELKEDYGNAYFNRGISKNRIDRDAAIEDWNKAVSYGVLEAARYIHTR